MSENIRPARAISPGRIILREIEARGWTQQDLAAILGRPEQLISEIVRGKKQITPETARQLAKAFGTSPDFWLNLEMQYQLHQVIKGKQENEIECRSKLYNLAPINEMIRRGWIRASNSVDELEREYCKFFQVSTVDQKPEAAFRLRTSEDRGPEERSIVAWVRRVEELAREQDVPEFSKTTFPQIVSQLLALTQKESDIVRIPPLLIENGIHFVIVSHLPKTYLDGAAFWISEKPVIALSLRYDRIDAFWFTLLHELAHIFLGHKQDHIDQLFDRKDDEPGREEKEANRQAAEWLFPEDVLSEFIEWNHPRYSRKSIECFATEHGRHPGIVIGQLMHRNEVKYSHLREYLVKVRPILSKWEEVPFAS